MNLLIIDGNSMLFRGYYATCYGNLMQTKNGVYTNAVYAFSNMLFKALDTIRPTHCAVAFDKGKHTFRHEIDSSYKAGRAPTPEPLIPQFALAREFLTAANIPYLEFDDIEADDIVGSLSKSYPGIKTTILSSDRDLLQLIDDSTTVYLMTKGISEMAKMDEAALLEKYDLTPSQIIDWKGLMGDPSDNIPGVKGIGEKTAIKLLKSYGSCEGVYDHIDELKGKMKENLIADKEICFMSKQLATIKTDVDFDQSLDDFFLNLNYDSLNAFYEQYEMRSLMRNTNKKAADSKPEYREVKKISASFFDQKPFVYFESDCFSYYNRKVYGLSFATGTRVEYISLENLLLDSECLDFLKGSDPKTVYDFKACKHCASYNGFALGEADDLMLTCFLNYNYLASLEEIFRYYGKEIPKTIPELYGTEKKPLNPENSQIIEHACSIAYAAFSSYLSSYKELKDKELIDLYENVEKPLSSVLYEMENTGINCDLAVLREIAIETKKKMDEDAEVIYSLAGHPFNINSPKQLAEVLFDELGLPGGKKRSTSVEVLEELSHFHPIADALISYRKQSKIYSTYAEGLQKYVKDDGKIHTIYSQTVTQTGRLSSYEPNLQNISVRDEDGKTIRKAFSPSAGCVFMDSDYSQIELRVLASLSNESKMIEAFNNGVDIHSATACDVFGLEKDQVTDEIRRRAKAVNFGIVYGISDFGLAKQTGITRKEASHFIENYYRTYPNIKKYMEDEVSFCENHGYVLTIMKRRRYIKEIKDHNYMMREFGKRAAMNAPIQGSAADLMKIAMIRCDRLMKEKNVKSKMILQIHDELLFEVPEDEVEIMKEIIRDGMDNAMDLNVALESSMGIAKNWYEAK
ncbi:MAG: DNA polymerase I [Erysipelotrichaceae bacterium]|nr:DNA polymerase I [Erysipelotrichaceae bacterium]